MQAQRIILMMATEKKWEWKWKCEKERTVSPSPCVDKNLQWMAIQRRKNSHNGEERDSEILCNEQEKVEHS